VQRRWSWDLSRIHAKGYTDNVVDLIVGKSNRLPVETQNALKQLACLGNSAEFAMLTPTRKRRVSTSWRGPLGPDDPGSTMNRAPRSPVPGSCRAGKFHLFNKIAAQTTQCLVKSALGKIGRRIWRHPQRLLEASTMVVQNRVLAAMAPTTFDHLRPLLHPIVLRRRAILQEYNRPIEHIYFIERGFASIFIRTQCNGLVEASIVGRLGFVGASAVLGTMRSPIRCLMEVRGRR
jgi:hypothetical protein